MRIPSDKGARGVSPTDAFAEVPAPNTLHAVSAQGLFGTGVAVPVVGATGFAMISGNCAAPHPEKPPYVCNGCTREGICVLRKKFYVASVAQKECKSLPVKSHQRIIVSDEERIQMMDFLSADMKKGTGHRIDPEYRKDRTNEDCKAFLATHPDSDVVEIDSVEGTKGGKVLLPLNFNCSTLMPCFIRNANTSQPVIDKRIFINL